MDATTLVLGIVITVLAAAFVAWPFLRPQPSSTVGAPGVSSGTERRRWERQKAEAYAAIKEAEFDHGMGKLSVEDFGALRDKYMAQAAAAHEALDAAAAPRARASGRGVAYAFCPDCGGRAAARAKFCSACGRAFDERVA